VHILTKIGTYRNLPTISAKL